MPEKKMSADELVAFLREEFPQLIRMGFDLDNASISEQQVVLPLQTTRHHLRPGGTVSGPTLMTMADTAAYLAIMARLGPVALAVTTSLEMHFLRKPEPGRIEATCKLLKLGRRLAVASVDIHDATHLVAHATVTYAIPQD